MRLTTTKASQSPAESRREASIDHRGLYSFVSIWVTAESEGQQTPSNQQELWKKWQKSREVDPWNSSFDFVLILPFHISSDLREEEAILNRKDGFERKHEG